MIYTPHKTPGELCHAVDRVAKAAGHVLTARPHNMYDPDRTIWWLVPSTDWPAYRHAKLFFDWQNDDRDNLWAGAYVEKGLDPSVEEFAQKKSWVMRPGWAWHDLIRRLRAEPLRKHILELAGDLPMPVQVKVEGMYAGVPSFDPDLPHFDSDAYVFTLDADTQRFTLAGAPRTRGHVLGDLTTVQTFDDLSRALEMVTKNAWIWVDFMVMIGLRIGEPPTAADDADWRDATLWTRFLQPLQESLV